MQFVKLPYFNLFFSFSQVHTCKVKNTNLYGSLMKLLHELREFFIFRACTADWGSQLFQFIQLLHLQFGGQSPAFTTATLNQSSLFILLDKYRLSSDALSVGSSWTLATVWIWMVAVVSVMRIDGYSDEVLLARILLVTLVFFRSTYKAPSVQLHNAGSASQRLLTHPITQPFTHHRRPIKNMGFKSKLLWLFNYYFELQWHHRFIWTCRLRVNQFKSI